MELRTIETKEQHENMLEWVDKQFDAVPDPNSSKGAKLKNALALIKAYEDVHYPASRILHEKLGIPAKVFLG